MTLLPGGNKVITDPLSILKINGTHKQHCPDLSSEFFEHKEQLTLFKSTIMPDTKLRQSWETYRANYIEKNPGKNLPDYSKVKY